jgi:hypothetical protein
MRRITILACGVFAYLTFQVSFLYLFAFMAGIVVPKTVDYRCYRERTSMLTPWLPNGSHGSADRGTTGVRAEGSTT